MKFNKLIAIMVVLAVVAVIAAVKINAASLSSSMSISLASTLSTSGLSTTRDTVAYAIQKSLDVGSGTTAVADLVYSANRTLLTAATESLDLYGGLTDNFGTTLNFARMKFLVIENTSGSMTLTIGTTTASIAVPFLSDTSTVTIPPYGALALAAPLAGWAVTNDTGDKICIANGSGSSTTYRVWIIGSSM